MTTYSYKITLTDSEAIMLEEALTMMIRHCEAMGGTAPFNSWLSSAREVQGRLHSDTVMTSYFRVDPD